MDWQKNRKQVMRKKIFISSVQKEFADERAVLYKAITTDPLLSRFFEPLSIECAADRRAEDIYLEAIASADVFVAIIGHEYGAPTNDGISIIHKEFRWATKQKIPRLIFIKGNKRKSCESRLQKFTNEIQQDGFIYQRFTNVIDLKEQLYINLIRTLKDDSLLNLAPKKKLKQKVGKVEKKPVFLVQGHDEAARHMNIKQWIKSKTEKYGWILAIIGIPPDGYWLYETMKSNIGFTFLSILSGAILAILVFVFSLWICDKINNVLKILFVKKSIG